MIGGVSSLMKLIDIFKILIGTEKEVKLRRS